MYLLGSLIIDQLFFGSINTLIFFTKYSNNLYHINFNWHRSYQFIFLYFLGFSGSVRVYCCVQSFFMISLIKEKYFRRIKRLYSVRDSHIWVSILLDCPHSTKIESNSFFFSFIGTTNHREGVKISNT